MSASLPTEDSTTNVIVAVLMGAALVCAFDMIVLITGTFRSWRGLYFWSLVAATGGQILVLISLVLGFWVFTVDKTWVPLIFSTPGYLIYVPAQFAILWSRLHLLMASSKMRRFVLIATICEFVIIEIPSAVLYILPEVSTASLAVLRWSDTWWQVEAIAYLLLDMIFVATYNLQMYRIWPIDQAMAHQKRTLRHIMLLTFFILFVDVAYIVSCYRTDGSIALALEVSEEKFTCISLTLQGFLYTYKLQAEIWTLNSLTALVQQPVHISYESSGEDAFREPSKATSD
jgi:hypothetical protein